MNDAKNEIFVAATIVEASLLIRAWLGRRRWPIRWRDRGTFLLWKDDRHRHSPTIVVCGVAPEAARNGLRTALAEIGPVGSVIGFGFLGGLVKSARPGDLVIPTEVRWGRHVEVPTEWLRMSLASHAPSVKWRKIVTVETVVETPVEKAALFAATGAEAVDLESAAWGEVCRTEGLPWAVVRTVLDGGDEILPARLATMADSFGRPKWTHAAARFVLHPGDARAALKIYRQISKSGGYADVITSWLRAKHEEKRKERGEPAVVSEVR